MSTHRKNAEHGQITIMLAIVMAMVMILTAFVVDGGYGMVQMRRAQNASDFASIAASSLTPCSIGANQGVTGLQVQKTVQAVVNANVSGNTAWTANYLDKNGAKLAGSSFSSSSTLAPPATACGVTVQVTGTWNTWLAGLAGFKTETAGGTAGATGNGNSGYSLAVASLLPYSRHTIYAGAVGQFTVNGNMYDNSVAQCNDRDNSCLNYAQCLSSTPLANIVCYGDSADVFESSSERITGTLYSVAPVSVDPCFYQAPTSGVAKAMSSTQYPQYYNTYGCNGSFSSATSPISYGGIQGNVTAIGDPLAGLPDPTDNNSAAAICPGQSSYATSTGGVYTSGTLTPGVYTGTVVLTGSVTLNPCKSGSSVTAPGVYIFQKGLEICPPAGSTVTVSDSLLYSENAPSNTYSNLNANTVGYCASAEGSNNAVTNGIEVSGDPASTVNITSPDSGPFQGIALYQDRNINENVGLDDGWTHRTNGYTAAGATITINGVVYDNSDSNERSGTVFSTIGQTYSGPWAAICTGATNVTDTGDPVPCPGSTGVNNTAGTVSITGAVIVGAFGTQGGTTGNPLTLTITFDSSSVPVAIGRVRLVF